MIGSGPIVIGQAAEFDYAGTQACYGYLIPALDRLKEEGILEKLNTKICIGQGYRGKTGTLGIGSCTRGFASCLQGCPPTDEEIYQFLKKCIQEKEERI